MPHCHTQTLTPTQLRLRIITAIVTAAPAQVSAGVGKLPHGQTAHLDAPGQRHGQQPVSGTADPAVVKQDKSFRGSIDTSKTCSDPQRVVCSGERPIGAVKGQPNKTKPWPHARPPSRGGGQLEVVLLQPTPQLSVKNSGLLEGGCQGDTWGGVGGGQRAGGGEGVQGDTWGGVLGGGGGSGGSLFEDKTFSNHKTNYGPARHTAGTDIFQTHVCVWGGGGGHEVTVPPPPMRGGGVAPHNGGTKAAAVPM